MKSMRNEFSSQLFIDNTDVAAADGATFERLNPLTGEVATRAAAATVADARRAAESAASAFTSWSLTSAAERRRLLLRVADTLASRQAEFLERVHMETATYGLADIFNVRGSIAVFQEAAALTTQISGNTIPSDIPGVFSMTVRKPAGVVLSIASWNAAMLLSARAIAYPLACGNTVVLKGSEMCPATHAMWGSILKEAGFPSGVCNIITNAPADGAAVVNALIAHPAIRRVNFTGSSRVGRLVAESAGRHLKPVLLELGGKSAIVVLDDANIEEAVNAAAFGAFAGSGQGCLCTERVVLDESIADEFLEKFIAKTKSLKVGDPRVAPVVVGSLIDRNSVMRIEGLVQDAVAKGASVLLDGVNAGTIMSPTILSGVTSEMNIHSEEGFGPLVSIFRAKGVEDAIRIANDTDYGLSAAVFGNDITRTLEVARRMDCGMVHINGPTIGDEPQTPFGGNKASGYGKFGGREVIAEFTELCWITIQNPPRHYPF